MFACPDTSQRLRRDTHIRAAVLAGPALLSTGSGFKRYVMMQPPGLSKDYIIPLSSNLHACTHVMKSYLDDMKNVLI
jgi:hypothetical protein